MIAAVAAISLAVGAATMPSAASPSPAADEVVARVGGETISAAAVRARVQEAGVPPLVALESVIQEAVVVAAARAAGMSQRADVQGQLAAERSRLAIELLLEKVVFPTIAVSDEEVRQAFHATADRVRLSMVVRATREEAAASLARLRSGASLIEEARTSPDPIVRDSSGVLGWVPRRGLAPELAQAAFSARLLEPTGPVPAGKGYAVILVHERVLGSERDLAARADELRRTVRLSKRDDATARFVTELRRRRGATVNRAILESLRAADGAAPRPELVVARAGDVVVTAAELSSAVAAAGVEAKHADEHRAAGTHEAIARQLLDRKLIEAEITRRALDRDPEIGRALVPIERRVLVETYLRETVEGKVAVTPPEVESHYRQNLDDYTVPPRRECLHVVVREPTAMDAARERLTAGQSFEEVARLVAQRGEGHAGAEQLTQQQFGALARPDAEPELVTALEKTPPDTWTKPVLTKAGWALYRCGAWLPAALRPFAEVKNAIAEQLRNERAQAAVSARIGELRRAARVVVDEQALGRLIAAK